MLEYLIQHLQLDLNSYEKEDFGQTLGKWGAGEGCYLVLPVLGPSTARDAIASLGNYMGGDAWYNVTVEMILIFLQILIIMPLKEQQV